MNDYTTDALRNISLNGHSSAGKTMLTEALLFQTRQIDRMGRPDDGNTVSDYDPEEIKRKRSINTALLPIEYNKLKFNLLDCPGYRDFAAEIRSGARVCETMLIVLSGHDGVQVGSEFAWRLAQDLSKPAAVFINKLDQENSSFEKSLQSLRDEFGVQPVALTLPVGAELNFSGVIDLLKMKAVQESPGQKPAYADIPEELRDAAEAARAALVEAAAEGDEALMEKFLADEPLTPEEVLNGLKGVLLERRFIPVLCGSAAKCLGIEPLLNFFADCAPHPGECPPVPAVEGERKMDPGLPYAAFVFRTASDNFLGKVLFFKVISGVLHDDMIIHNQTQSRDEKVAHYMTLLGKKPINCGRFYAGDIGALTKHDQNHVNDTWCDPAAPILFPPTPLPKPVAMMALFADNKADEEKIGVAIHRIMESDPSITIRRDAETHETVISGLGFTHLEVAVSRLKELSRVDVKMKKPRVPYRESITRTASGNYRHKKQSGGRGQFGEVFLRLEPLKNGDTEYEFAWEVVGGNIPTNYQSSVDKGVQQALAGGILAGYKVVGVKVACFDGKYHTVDSSDMAFQIAGAMGFRQVAQTAGPIILEPIVNSTITVLDENMGDVMGSISGKRGRPMGSETKGKYTTIKAQVPLAEMYDFSKELRSMTQGRGNFEIELSHYEPVPPEIQKQIIAEYQREHAAGEHH